jgi:hypothetical protein
MGWRKRSIETCCLHLTQFQRYVDIIPSNWKWRKYLHSNRFFQPTVLNFVRTQKVIISMRILISIASMDFKYSLNYTVFFYFYPKSPRKILFHLISTVRHRRTQCGPSTTVMRPAIWFQKHETKRYEFRPIIILSAFIKDIIQLYVVLLTVQRTYCNKMLIEVPHT